MYLQKLSSKTGKHSRYMGLGCLFSSANGFGLLAKVFESTKTFNVGEIINMIVKQDVIFQFHRYTYA